MCTTGARFANASESDLAGLPAAFAPVYATLEEDPQTKSFAITYDLLDRLTQVCYTQACTGQNNFITWTYEGVGNRKTEARSQGTTNYTYNDTDQLTVKSGPQGTTNYGYDLNGNETSAGSRTFVYDLENRLV